MRDDEPEDDKPEPPTPADASLAQTALEFVRGLCKGNGVKMDSVTLGSFKGVISGTTASTLIEIRPQTSEKKIAGKTVVGTVVNGPSGVQQAVDETLIKAVNNNEARGQMVRLLMSRPDQGFGLHGSSLNIDFLSKDFCWHENCKTCHGQGRAPCVKCHGTQRELCLQCHGKTMVPCMLCKGTGHVNGPNGRPQPCSKCHGQRQVICMMCHRTGKIPCRQCKGTGTSVCTACSGSGWFTHIAHLATQAITYFQYDRVPVPAEIMPIMDTDPASLVKNGDIKIEAKQVAQPNVIGVEYDVKYPYGDITFGIRKKPLKAHLFGYNARLLEMPDFLETLIGRGYSELEAAAAGAGSVSSRLKQAGKFRIIALALLNAAQSSSKKTIAMLTKKYPMGLSAEKMRSIAELADKATALITRKPRYYGLGIGLVIVAAFYAAYYIGPGRAMIAPYIGNPDLNIIIDLFIIFMGGTITTISIQMAAGRALREALGHLVPPKDRKRLIPKTRTSGWWGYVGGIIIYFIMIEATVHIESAATPVWYETARTQVVQMIGTQQN